MAYIFCCKEASVPIKTYSPEVIVLPLLRTTAEAEQEFNIAHGDSLTTEQYEQVKNQVVEDLTAWIKPLHALVIGPGLGRDPLVLSCAMAALSAARERDLPVILDGDALFALNSDLDVVQGYTRCILTPNPAEYRRLYLSVSATIDMTDLPEQLQSSSVNSSSSPLDTPSGRRRNSRGSGGSNDAPSNDSSTAEEKDADSKSNLGRSTATLSASQVSLAAVTHPMPDDDDSIWNPKSVKILASALGGVTIIRKGQVDVISDGRRTVSCSRPGGLRRCGGQGDILAGIAGTLAGWNFGPLSGYEQIEKLRKREGHRFACSRTLIAAWGACNLTREASHRAYEEHHRGTTTPHILEHIGPAFYDLCEHYTAENSEEGGSPDYIQELL